MRLFILPGLLLFMFTGCASAPAFDTTRVDRSLTPRNAASELAVNRGKSVLWGGVILNTTNLADSTQLEVLAYPLDSDNRPQRDSDPLGRFIVENTGFLDPVSYSQGRLITVLGTLGTTLSGKVGASDYTYAVIEVKQLHLWLKDRDSGRSNVHFGIGVGIGL